MAADEQRFRFIPIFCVVPGGEWRLVIGTGVRGVKLRYRYVTDSRLRAWGWR